jgi:hypothetical protein
VAKCSAAAGLRRVPHYRDLAIRIIHNMEHALELTAVVGLENATLNSGAKASALAVRVDQAALLRPAPPQHETPDRDRGGEGASLSGPIGGPSAGHDRGIDPGSAACDLSPDERANLEIDLSPREYIIDYLERAFPTRQMRVFKDDTGAALTSDGE